MPRLTKPRARTPSKPAPNKPAPNKPAPNKPAPSKPTPTRAERQSAIVTVLGNRPVRSQAELQQALAGRGIAANQATLSRDLRELGVLKGQHGYELPPAAAGSGNGAASAALTKATDIRLAARNWLVTATPAENLVVLHTPTGGAQPLALALDNAELPELLA